MLAERAQLLSACARSAHLLAFAEVLLDPGGREETRIGPFVALAWTVTYSRADIQATLFHGVNNGRTESLNTKVRLIARRAFGFRSAPALIALSELALGGLCPSLPGRQPW